MRKKYDPLKDTIKESVTPRLEKLAVKAGTSYKSSIKLFCLECVGYDYPEAKDCETNTCPLWNSNKRIFRGKETYDE